MVKKPRRPFKDIDGFTDQTKKGMPNTPPKIDQRDFDKIKRSIDDKIKRRGKKPPK
jgi:hypothetical protein